MSWKNNLSIKSACILAIISEQVFWSKHSGVAVWWITTYSNGIIVYSTLVEALPPHTDFFIIFGQTSGNSEIYVEFYLRVDFSKSLVNSLAKITKICTNRRKVKYKDFILLFDDNGKLIVPNKFYYQMFGKQHVKHT